ncbi:MAG: FeoA domain-containing protein [Planctomycetes bacterium]|nr:FeoA domain-containing protein [Planctomycetota bacterium]
MRFILICNQALCASPSVETIPITQLRRGEVADISQVVGSAEQVRRLEELGLRAGARLEVVRGGSPCIVRVGGAKLCFRHDELLHVLVTPRKTT